MYVINTNTGILHTKNCADGETKFEPIKAGRRKMYPSIENAQNDVIYMGMHNSPDCLGSY